MYGEYFNDINLSQCSIKGNSTLNNKYLYYDNIINKIEDIKEELNNSHILKFSPSEITEHDVGKLTHINSNVSNGVGYNLFAPFLGNYSEILNLNAGFIDKKYSHSMSML